MESLELESPVKRFLHALLLVEMTEDSRYDRIKEKEMTEKPAISFVNKCVAP